MKTVLAVRVTAVVEYVSGVFGVTAENAVSVRKTSAKDGAGTLTWHVPALVSQFTLRTSRLPWRRPSDWNWLPSVCRTVRRDRGQLE